MKKLLLMLSLLVLMVACGGKSTGNKVVFNAENEPTSLDPQILTDFTGFVITDHLYEGLVRLNEKNEVSPAGAESWKISEDGKTWTFKLRKNKWSNGDEVTAKDFVRGIERGLNPTTASEYAFLGYYIENAQDYNEGKVKDFSKVGVKALDDYTLEFKLKAPTAYFSKLLIMPVFFPVNEKAINEFKDKYATEAKNSIYNGAYSLEEWVHDDKVVMKKRADYWNAANIKIDTLEGKFVSDFEAATNLFKNKELLFTKINVEKLAEYKDDPSFVKAPDGRVQFLAFNPKNPVLKNDKIKKALSLAINRDDLVKSVLNGAGVKGSGIVAGGVPGVSGDFRAENGDLYAQYKDLDVKALFNEGLKELNMTPDQVKLTLLVDEVGTGKKEAEFYQEQWKEKLGIDVAVEVKTKKERLASAKSGDYDIVRYGWGPDYADAMTYLELFVTGGSINIPKYSNPEYDKLIKFAQVNTDAKARVEAMQKAEKILAESFVISPLYYQDGLYLKDPSLEGLILRAFGNGYDFHQASIK